MEKYYKYSMDIKSASIVGLTPLLLLFIFPFSIGIFEVGIFFFWLLLHEILHGIGFMMGKGVKVANVVYGIALEKGVFYCMCKQRIQKRIIITSLLLPLITIGIGTLVWGAYLNNYLLTSLSIMNLCGCCMDFFMLLFILKLPKDAEYIDFDDMTSFTFISREDLSRYKSFAIQLEELGEYKEEEMYPRDKKRITITKTSWIVLAVIWVFTILGFFIT